MSKITIGLLTILSLLSCRSAFADSPVDFSRKDVQLYTIAAFAVQTTSYRIMRKTLGIPKLESWIISTLLTGSLSVAYDNYKDGKGYIGSQRQLGTLVGITIGTTISIALD